MATIIIRLTAGHDRNGNGRRVFVALSERGYIIGTVKDTGADDWKERWPRAAAGVSLETTLKEYRELVKMDADTQRMMRGGKR